MLRKFRAIVYLAAALWLIALIQILVTRVWVSRTGFTQAFARNQVTVESFETAAQNEDMRNAAQGNTCVAGEVDGKLSDDEKEKLAAGLFASLGGGTVMSGSEKIWSDYYVAYGYTSGISESRRINGKRINMNVAISYDEENDTTKVVMGSPLINSDF